MVPISKFLLMLCSEVYVHVVLFDNKAQKNEP